MTRRALLWRRVQETPLEMTVAWVGIFVGLFRTITDLDSLSSFTMLFWFTLMAGGVLYLTGRLRVRETLALLNVQSAGLALLIGGYAFLLLRSSGGLADDPLEFLFYVFRYFAIAAGLGVRLWVTRKAVKGGLEVA